MKIGCLAVGVFALAVSCPAVSFDGWRVIASTGRDESDLFQVRVADDGLHATVDRSKLNGDGAKWYRVEPPADRRPEIAAGGEVRMVYRCSANGPVRGARSLWICDAKGEEFRFSPISAARIDERVTVTYGIYGRFDSPLRMRGVVLDFDRDAPTGEFVLESFACVSNAVPAGGVRVCETAVSFEKDRDRFLGSGRFEIRGDGLHAVSTNSCVWIRYARFPGMKPFPAAEDIVVRTSTNWEGVVCLNLVDAVTRGKMRLKSPWRTEMHFTTNMPAGCHWQLVSMEFWPRFARGKPCPKTDFTIFPIKGVYRTSGAAACRLEADTGNALHVARNERERPSLVLRNPSDAEQAWKGVLHCRDYFDRGFDEPVDVRVKPGEAVRFRLPWPLAKGIWRVYGEIAAADGSKAFPEARFAVLDEHPRTPRFARGAAFRPGINWHADRFLKGDRELCEDALEACGCKLVRAGGFHFSSVEYVEGEYDWKMSDAIMAELVERGISLDTIVYGPPRWTQDTNRIARAKHFKAGMVPTRPGTFGAFAEKVAARYGTKIDYYELGNEWDLVPERVMTRDEAVRVHREGYAGLKRGCSDAFVIPKGWTGPDVRPDHYGKDPEMRVGGDYQAYVMTRVRDNCDAYPIHMHGDFRSYRGNVRRFLELRRSLGCENLPWFSNETSASSVNGQEDEVAKFVFQKIMYAWANGSVDYIWYNLKATGWAANDSEQGYGMLTADYQPRASFAAFSAFTAVYLGLAFDGTVIDRSSRIVYRFKGERNGRRQLVFGGWDSAAVEPRVIRVATDAARAERVDLMGNRTELKVTDGTVAWEVSALPCSLVLEEATVARPDEKDLTAIPTPPDAVIDVPAACAGRAPDVRLRTADRMTDYHQAIPETRHRVWQGPQDLSADVWFERTGNDLKVVVEVTDDVSTAGDTVEAELCVPGGRATRVTLPMVAGAASPRRHEYTFRGNDCGFDAKRLHEGVSFRLQVNEDDGEGEDGCLRMSHETEPLKLLRFRDGSAKSEESK